MITPMKTMLSFFALLLFSIAVSGQSLTGTWIATVPADDAGNTQTLKFVIKSDNTFIYDEGNDGQVEEENTYAVEGNKIHFKIKGENCSGEALCEFELKDEKTLFLKPLRIDCGDGGVPPPLTLTKQ